MKTTSAAAAILALAAVLFLSAAGGPAVAAPGALQGLSAPGDSGEPALSPKEARVEAWWLVSVFRFDEAKKLLSSLEKPDKEEIELAGALGDFATSLVDFLVTRGKGVVFKLRGGGVLKGKPIALEEGPTIVLHNKKKLPLSRLSWTSVGILAKSAAKRKGPETEALCAVCYLLGGEKGKAKAALRRAGGPHLEAVKAFAAAWSSMKREFAARELAGLVLGGDLGSFRASAAKLVSDYKDTAVYERLKKKLRAAAVSLLHAEGKIGGSLHAIENKDLGNGRRRLVYGFVSAGECEDFEMLSFEEATKDLDRSLRGFLLAVANGRSKKAGAEPLDVEKKPSVKEDQLLLPPGSAIRHRLRFKGSITVTCEVAIDYGSEFSLPYAVVHGGKDRYIHAFYWRLCVGEPGGILLEPEIERKKSYKISGDTVDMTITFKRTRKETTAALVYEGEDCGKVEADEVEGGYLLFGVIGVRPATFSRVIIEGRVDPESQKSLADVRIAAAAEKLFPW